MATQQEIDAAKAEGRNIAKDFVNEEGSLGYSTLHVWAYNEDGAGLQGDFTDAERGEILDASAELLPAVV